MPTLSIVVPTRERSDTLFHTIRTLVDQDYQDCEILISDNASKDNTRQVVESFSDSRIRYENTGKRVSMSENWEYALQRVRGDFVTYIGDDDGFIPGALTKAMRLLEQSPVDALVWSKIEYAWPDYIDENWRNWFSLQTDGNVVQMADGRKKLRMVMLFHEVYNRLPCIYNGIVRRTLLDKVVALSTNGLFFNSISPDVFSGIALSMIVDGYLLTDYPFSVSGASRHSIGTSFGRQPANGEDTPAAKFMSEIPRAYDPRIPMTPSIVAIVMGEYLLARQFFPGLRLPEPHWGHYIRAMIKNAKSSFFPDEVLRSAAHTARAVGLSASIPDTVVPSARLAAPLGIRQNTFSFKAPVDMVSNVHDACRLVAGMLPSAIGGDDTPPYRKFVSKIRDCVISEAKTLFRSF